MARPKKSFLKNFLSNFKRKKGTRGVAVSSYFKSFFALYGRVIFFSLLFIFVVLAGILVFSRTKSFIFAGAVNGQYIGKNVLVDKLIKSSGRDEFDALVNEKLIEQEAKKRNVKASSVDRQKKVSEYEAAVGGKDVLKSRLASGGVAEAEFNRRVDLEIMIEKMFADKSSFTEEELKKFWDENKEQLVSGEATVSATPNEEARKQLARKKISEAFNQWLSEVRKNAKIDYFLAP